MRKAILLVFVLITAIAGRASETPSSAAGAAAANVSGKLFPLVIRENRLELDPQQWASLKPLEREDLKARRERIGRIAGLAPEKIPPEAFTAPASPNPGEGCHLIGFLDSAENDFNGPFSLLYESKASEHEAGQVLYLEHKAYDQQYFSIYAVETGVLVINFVNHKTHDTLNFVQTAGGPVTLSAKRGKEFFNLNAKSFPALLRENPDKAQTTMLHPLAELGILLPPSIELPVVMALATSGACAPEPALEKEASALIVKLGDPNAEIRGKAIAVLIPLYPRAIQFINHAAKVTGPMRRSELLKVIAAHPGIARARPFVDEKKLYNDRPYLLGIMAQSPYFKAAARMRLAVLFGKDYGSDPKDWPDKITKP